MLNTAIFHFFIAYSCLKNKNLSSSPGDFCVAVLLWDKLERCAQCHCLQGVCQVVCAACKPPDVSETSHWRSGGVGGGWGGGRRSGGNSRQSGLITTGAWMPSGALGTDSRSGTHLDSETVPWKKLSRSYMCTMRRADSAAECTDRCYSLKAAFLDLTILLAGVDAIRAGTIQALCHVMREKFFFFHTFS